ncbi:MAG TPA: ECF-type sigma factor [Thermoanaerobaculia bacterium]|nr:ECF-type sigma factor [Thermoanaerobaculia bacterium]
MPGAVTELLVAWRAGDRSALERLMAAVYPELRRAARGQLARERRGHTLAPTALVNEVFLRLVEQRKLAFENRGHFLALAATLMHRILVSQARARLAAKRGSAGLAVTLLEDAAATAGPEVEVLALHDALADLARREPRQARTVELRYFGGLTVEEIAQELAVSPSTVKADWYLARAWLHRRLSPEARHAG